MRDLAGYLIYRSLSFVIGLLPEPAMRRAGEGIGYALSYIAVDRRRLVERNLSRVVGNGADLTGLARSAFASYGRYWAEVFWMRPSRYDTVVDHSDVEGADYAYEVLAAGNGLILALPHLGNWEAAGAKANAIGLRVLAAAEALANRRVVAWFSQVRAACGIDVVIAGKGSRVTADLMRRLADGGVIALVADRDVSGRGVEVEFFGETTTMPAGAVALADRTGASIVPVGTYFNQGRGHVFIMHPRLELSQSPDRSTRIEQGTQALAHRLEDIIRQAPEQWHLFQPNWPADRPAAQEGS